MSMPNVSSANPAAPAPSLVLLVDDERPLRLALRRILEHGGHSVTEASNGHEAIGLVEGARFDVIVSDIRMPGMDGVSLLKAIRGRDLDVPVVFLTGSPALESAVAALEYGALQYLTKPIDAAQLQAVVARAAKVHRLALARRLAAEEQQGKALGDRAGLEVRYAAAVDQAWMAMQPILSWRTRSIFAYEALLRTEEESLRNPLDFVDAAERLSRTRDLGRLVRQKVADAMITMPPSIKVFVNVHPSDLFDDELSSSDGALTPFAHGVVLEVTERATLDGLHGIGGRIGRLRELGYRIALDDLGAGYAGLSSFAQLTPEVVKVDMSLIRGFHQSEIKQKLFRSFATVCRELNTELVAEGVETSAERDCLNELGGDLYQGYLFARPGRGFPQPSY